MKFGLNPRRKLTGAELVIRIQQVCALLPVLYLFTASSFPAILSMRSPLSFLFDLGLSCLPRAESLGLSLLYRLSRSEVWVNIALLGFALVLGLAAAQLLRGSRRKARAVRWVLIVWIAADLLLRLLPLHCNGIFGLLTDGLGFAVQALSLVLTVLDLRADRKESAPENTPPVP